MLMKWQSILSFMIDAYTKRQLNGSLIVAKLNRAIKKACKEHGGYKFIGRDSYWIIVQRRSDQEQFCFARLKDMSVILEGTEQDLFEIMLGYLNDFDREPHGFDERL